MAGTISFPTRASSAAKARAGEKSVAIPWYIWCSVLAVTSAMIGAHWDISWHRSIGRDGFWTPAHVAIYMCGVLVGISCAYLILSATFAPVSGLRDASVKMWGFRGPLGAFISAWGGMMMIASAPFDNWWHNAYGLDVKVLSPPHVVLIAGTLAVEAGTLILILGYMNRAEGMARHALNWLFLYIGGMILVLMTILTMEDISRIFMHTGRFYRVVAMAIPVVLAGISRASRSRWPCMIVAGIYTAFLCGVIWILPLFPAQPKLGPVYHNVTQFIPPQFPLLLIVPAIVLDLLWRKLETRRRWVQALVAGAAFLAVFFAAQWFFADFLMSPASRNWFFATGYFDYLTPPSSPLFRNVFWPLEATASAFWLDIGLAFVLSILLTRLGIAWGDWMRRVRR